MVPLLVSTVELAERVTGVAAARLAAARRAEAEAHHWRKVTARWDRERNAIRRHEHSSAATREGQVAALRPSAGRAVSAAKRRATEASVRTHSTRRRAQRRGSGHPLAADALPDALPAHPRPSPATPDELRASYAAREAELVRLSEQGDPDAGRALKLVRQLEKLAVDEDAANVEASRLLAAKGGRKRPRRAAGAGAEAEATRGCGRLPPSMPSTTEEDEEAKRRALCKRRDGQRMRRRQSQAARQRLQARASQAKAREACEAAAARVERATKQKAAKQKAAEAKKAAEEEQDERLAAKLRRSAERRMLRRAIAAAAAAAAAAAPDVGSPRVQVASTLLSASCSPPAS